MLQDLSFGQLENEFYDRTPADSDIVIAFVDQSVLLRNSVGVDRTFLTYAEVMALCCNRRWLMWGETACQYVFHMQGRNYFLWMGDAGEAGDDYAYASVRTFREHGSKDQCFAVMTAWHLYVWYRNNRFCGCCGARTAHDTKERMLRCTKCGNMIFPRISPAVIVAVTDGDRLLMSKYAGRANTRYALIAGYTEIGETLEQTVHREVMEEVGLRVKNIRYYKSQPWGIDGNVLMGFYCDLDGSDEIHLDRQELALAEWHHRDHLPAKDDGFTLTREMIRVFQDGQEPKA